ncbi:NIPSNAP family protein [Rhodospirillaceae bacterium KN72]|uniref:NIPSNAP family protein n=1 Tax=Pacificispira spongiicola TaxID=2729598 RepID=A0A7Y0E2D1_9PROT|nr:NIPSNAP family protein [Pacificispira spongiicola]NMM45972.1 NIPSNAP family protein [Pacificispira spongiicola]
MSKTVEILLYTLRPGTGAEFHEIMRTVSVPLHASVGMDVVAFGQSIHDPDAYYLIRSYRDLRHLELSQAEFYKSDAWRNGPRTEIVDRITSSLKTVVDMPKESVEALRKGYA